MATRGGARAAGLGARKGMIARGMDADIIVIDLSAPHLVPAYDPYSTLVYAAGRSDVRQVLARGRRIVADGRPVAEISKELEMLRAVAAGIAAAAPDGS